MRIKDCVLLLAVALVIAYFREKREPEIKEVVKEVVKEVTRVEVDTVVHYLPMPYAVRTRPDTIVVRDTVLHVEEVEYKDSTYSVRISGYRPTLESIEIFRPNTITERVIYKKPRRWGVGVTAGYGVTKDGFSPSVTVGLNYRIW